MESVQSRVLQLLTHMLGKTPNMSDDFVSQLGFDSLDAVSLAMDVEELFYLPNFDETKLCDSEHPYTVQQLVHDIENRLRMN